MMRSNVRRWPSYRYRKFWGSHRDTACFGKGVMARPSTNAVSGGLSVLHRRWPILPEREDENGLWETHLATRRRSNRFLTKTDRFASPGYIRSITVFFSDCNPNVPHSFLTKQLPYEQCVAKHENAFYLRVP